MFKRLFFKGLLFKGLKTTSTSTYLLLMVGLLMSPTGAANGPVSTPEFGRLLNLVDQRLQLMKDVAAYKYANHMAIENQQRETVVLANAMASARQLELNPATLEPFFRLQIEMAKKIQKSWIESWQAQGIAPNRQALSADLKTDIRPALLVLGTQLVEQLPLALPELKAANNLDQFSKKVDATLTTHFVTPEMKRELLQSLLQIRQLAPGEMSVLAKILHSGVLRVGTTGDYPPFSFMDKTSGEYSGVDVDLARNLASSLGVELQFVHTSWPGLMADLAANKYDVGMSGISRTLLRQRTAFFSDAYSAGGKTPIARCDAVTELNSLHKIDQSSVRVIVNPGGTNEKFVRKHINHAQIMVYPDNTRIFHQIIERRADVMVTDAIEVKLQQHLHPELCATMPGKFLTEVDKAFLMPQDSELKEYVDVWLAQQKRSGKLQKVFARHLN